MRYKIPACISKARKRNTFYERKRVKGQYFWKTSFWLNKLVIRTYFKNQIQCGTCVNMQNPYFTSLFNGINTYETFWFYLIPKSVFEVIIADLYLVLPS